MSTPILSAEERSKRLASEAKSALDTLTKLLSPVENERTGKAGVRLPKAVVRHSQGLAFVVQRKVGLGVGVSHGTGFVINRLDREGRRWSAPSFFTITDVSLGLTLGVEKLDTVLALATPAAVEKLASGNFRVGADFAFEIGEAAELFTAPPQTEDAFGNPVPEGVLPEVLNKTHEEVWGLTADNDNRAVAYSISDSMIADVSIKAGVIKADADTNKALFGERATPALLLSEEIPAPAEFADLYTVLNNIFASVTPKLAGSSVFHENAHTAL